MDIQQQHSELWIADGLTYTELICQEYTNCSISAGTVEGHPVDTMYLRFVRHSEPGEPREAFYLLRPDEMAAIAWCASGVLWSHLISKPEDGITNE